VYRVIRTTYIGSAKNYNLLDEHGCIAAFNLRLSNIYELIRLRKLNILVLYAHLPSRAKLDIMLAALKVLKARFVTISEAF
jgi:hypothetical protein